MISRTFGIISPTSYLPALPPAPILALTDLPTFVPVWMSSNNSLTPRRAKGESLRSLSPSLRLRVNWAACVMTSEVAHTISMAQLMKPFMLPLLLLSLVLRRLRPLTLCRANSLDSLVILSRLPSFVRSLPQTTTDSRHFILQLTLCKLASTGVSTVNRSILRASPTRRPTNASAQSWIPPSCLSFSTVGLLSISATLSLTSTACVLFLPALSAVLGDPRSRQLVLAHFDLSSLRGSISR